MSRLNRKYGLIRGTPDKRDKIMRAPRIDLTLLPPVFSNMDLMTPVYDQGQSSSCTGNSHAAQEDACRILQGLPPLLGSRLFVYYNARLAEGSQGEDCGAQIRDILKAANRYGVCAETTWAFSPNLITIQPAAPAYTEAVRHRDLVYSSVPLSLLMFKQLLAHRYTINIGIQVYESFESEEVASTGVVPMPDLLNEQCLGGHAVLVIGYDDSKMAFQVRNSWGCYSDDTKVLTQRGWLLFKDTTDADTFFTLNPKTHKIELQKRSAYHAYDYDGELYSFKTSKLDLLVTPNHSMYVASHTNGRPPTPKEFVFIEAEHVEPRARQWIKRSGSWTGHELSIFEVPGYTHKVNAIKEVIAPPMLINMDDWLEFLGYWLAEGHITRRKCLRGGVEYSVHISQKKAKNIDKIYRCVQRLGVKACLAKTGISFANKQIYTYLKQFGYQETRYVPVALKQLSPRQLRILFDSLMLGDGSNTKCVNGSRKVTYYTTSEQLSTDMQEICLKLGLASSLYLDDRRGQKTSKGYNYNYIGYQVRIQGDQTRDAAQTLLERKHKGTQPYRGKVYCVTVPNHTLYVQRNGKSCWCGNSGWGDKGYFWLPYAYMLPDLMSDAWVLESVEADGEATA